MGLSASPWALDQVCTTRSSSKSKCGIPWKHRHGGDLSWTKHRLPRWRARHGIGAEGSRPDRCSVVREVSHLHVLYQRTALYWQGALKVASSLS